jgi:solute carrier family 66, member 2
VESFWYWNDFGSYILSMGVMICILTVFTYYFQESEIYIGTLGTLSSCIEAMLGVPQLYLNWQRKNTEGLAPLLIMMWLFGDIYKMMYYSSNNCPNELIFCSIF